MARSLPKVCPFLVTVDLKLKWPELPRPTLPKVCTSCRTYFISASNSRRGEYSSTSDVDRRDYRLQFISASNSRRGGAAGRGEYSSDVDRRDYRLQFVVPQAHCSESGHFATKMGLLQTLLLCAALSLVQGGRSINADLAFYFSPRWHAHCGNSVHKLQ